MALVTFAVSHTLPVRVVSFLITSLPAYRIHQPMSCEIASVLNVFSVANLNCRSRSNIEVRQW
jgi:hypothetical protein